MPKKTTSPTMLVVFLESDLNDGQVNAVVNRIKNLSNVTAVKCVVDKIPTRPHESILKQTIEALGLSRRAWNALNEQKVRTVQELVGLDEWDLLKFPNLGRGCLNEIKAALHAKNLTLAQRAA